MKVKKSLLYPKTKQKTNEQKKTQEKNMTRAYYFL